MHDIIHDILQKYWHFDSFREKQEEIILSVLAGKDTLGLLPTGGGKSLTFQIPAMAMQGLTLVVTPLIALMKDQVDGLKSKGIKAAYIHSGLKYAEIRNTIDKCIYGNCKFLYISPERLSSVSFIEALRKMPIALLAVDEAHCISQWGYDFRPSYLKIASVRHLFPNIPVLALSASATPEVVDDIMKQLEFREPNVIRKSFRRDNLSYIVRTQENKMAKLFAALSATFGSVIIYVRSRTKAKSVAEELKGMGFSAEYYHAGISSEEKRDKQDRWKSGEVRIMVATNAFGMGIDKPDVRLVAHLDIPNSLEEYYQEAGRAGRDGKRSYVLLLVSSKDKGTLKRRIAEAFPSKEFIKKVYTSVCDFLDIGLGGGFDKLYEFNFMQFCSTFKFPETQCLSALKILTACHAIEYIDEVETTSRIMILANKEQLYNIPDITPEMDRILEIILRNCSGSFSDYVPIDEASIAFKNGITRQSIYETLLFLNRRHILHYIPRRRTPYIYFPSSRVEPRHLEITREAYEDGKRRLEHRINAMLDYAFNAYACREQRIMAYFGEKADKCGGCDLCKENKKESSSEKELSDNIKYMLSLKDRTFDEIAETLPYSRTKIVDMLRFLSDEGIIHSQNGIFSLK